MRGPGADLGRPRDPFPGASRPRGQAGPKRPGQRSFLLLCACGEGWALPVSRCAERGQTSEPLGQALSAAEPAGKSGGKAGEEPAQRLSELPEPKAGLGREGMGRETLGLGKQKGQSGR